MSRTTRNYDNYAWYHKSDVSYEKILEEKKEIYYRYPYKWVTSPKPKEQYDQECEAALEDYQNRLRLNGGCEDVTHTLFGRYWTSRIYPRHVNRYIRTRVKRSVPDFEAEAKHEFGKQNRDGRFSETPRRTGFKKESAQHVRRKNKNFCRNVMLDEWEDEAYPIHQEGKHFKWNWW